MGETDGDMKEARWLWVVQLGVSLAVLTWLLKDLELRRPLMEAGGVRPWWLMAGLGWCLAMSCLSGLRWWLLLRVQGIEVVWHRVTVCAMAGLLFDAVLPGAAGGDLARALLLRRLGGVPVLTGLISLMVDHLSGLLALVVLAFGFTLGQRELLEATPMGTVGLYYLGLFVIGVGLTLMASFALSHPRLTGWVPAFVPGRSSLVKFAEAWHVYARDWRRSLLAGVVSVPLLLAHFSLFHGMLRAAGASVEWVDVMAVMPVVDVVCLLPVSFSGLGVREMLFVKIWGAGVEPGLLALGGVLGHLGLAFCGVAGWIWAASIRPHHVSSPSR